MDNDGTRVAVGAPFNEANGIGSGHVRVYEYDGYDWVQIGGDIDGEAAEDMSGFSVSLSNDGRRVAIGAYGNDVNGTDSGHVRVFEYDGYDWVQIGQDIDGEAAGDKSGFSVSLSNDGTRVAVGANFNDGYGTWSGHVRVYKYDNANWTQIGQDIDGEAALDFSGWAVSLNDDGTRVAIGAPSNNGNGQESGHVRVYELTCPNESDGSAITSYPAEGAVGQKEFRIDTKGAIAEENLFNRYGISVEADCASARGGRESLWLGTWYKYTGNPNFPHATWKLKDDNGEVHLTLLERVPYDEQSDTKDEEGDDDYKDKTLRFVTCSDAHKLDSTGVQFEVVGGREYFLFVSAKQSETFTEGPCLELTCQSFCGAVGDPYITPLVGDVFKLPLKSGCYRLLEFRTSLGETKVDENEDACFVNGRVQLLTTDEKQNLENETKTQVNARVELRDLDDEYKQQLISGTSSVDCFFTHIHIYCNGWSLDMDMNSLNYYFSSDSKKTCAQPNNPIVVGSVQSNLKKLARNNVAFTFGGDLQTTPIGIMSSDPSIYRDVDVHTRSRGKFTLRIHSYPNREIRTGVQLISADVIDNIRRSIFQNPENPKARGLLVKTTKSCDFLLSEGLRSRERVARGLEIKTDETEHIKQQRETFVWGNNEHSRVTIVSNVI